MVNYEFHGEARSMLRLEEICLRFGGVKALDEVSFSIERREIVSLIGPNGSGKTSALNVISGFYHPQKGKVVFEGIDITGFPPNRRAELGLSRTFQNLALYTRENVLENIMSGAIMNSKAGILDCAIYSRRAKEENVQVRIQAEEIIEFLGLDTYRYAPAGTLPIGRAKKVELARSLMLNPKFLLLDEVMAGLTMAEKGEMIGCLNQLRNEKDVTILLVEHDVEMVMKVSDRVIVMSEGRVIADGLPEKVVEDPLVVSAYLGG